MNLPGRTRAVLRRARALPWRRITLATGALFAIVVAVPPLRDGAAVITSRAILWAATPFAPGIDDFETLPTGSRVLAADGSVITTLDGSQRRRPVKLADLPEHVPQAVMAAEDEDFYDHSGVDPDAIFRAFVQTVRGKEQGGSTITQQLAKINYTSGERTVLRKVKEVLYATELEKRYSKDELLQRYLNQVYFGEGAYGIAAAAQTIFGVPAERLTVAQAALLAGKIRAPGQLDPRTELEAVQARRDAVLANMAEEGWIDDGEMEEAVAEPVQLAPPAPPDQASLAPHFVELVAREFAGLDEVGGSPDARRARLFTGGYTIETTLDPRAQRAAHETVAAALGEPGDPTAAVVSISPGDGAVRVLFGGLDPAARFDPASQGRRQPGSAFKPFVYLGALRDGIDPRSTLPATSPMVLGEGGEPWEVENYEGHSRPQSDLDEGMALSINTVYAQLILEVGPRDVLKTAEDAGIRKGFESQPSGAVALGGLTEGVSPLEMAAAFGTFAARGVHAQPYAITRVLDRDGRVVYEHEVDTTDAFVPEEVGNLNRALQMVVQRGTGRGAAIGRPVAGKTGTTSDYKDAWFVGYVPQLATAVWVGYPNEAKEMTDVHGRRVSGGSFPAEIFAGTMEGALEGVPVEPLYTASPDSLDLERLRRTASTRTTSPTSSTTSTSTPGSTTTEPREPTTTTESGDEPTPTTEPANDETTTTLLSTTTTTEKKQSTTTTTAGTQTQQSPTTAASSG